MTTLRARAVRVALAVASVTSSAAWAGGPPWSEPGSVPLGELVASAAFTREDEPLYRFPRADGPRRGSVFAGARLPIFASRTGPGCETTWLRVGPMAWVGRATVELSESAAIGALTVLMVVSPVYTYEHHLVFLLLAIGAAAEPSVGFVLVFFFLAWSLTMLRWTSAHLPASFHGLLRESKFLAEAGLFLLLCLRTRGPRAPSAPRSAPPAPPA